MEIPETLLALLGRPSTCYVATTMPDGSPQLTQTWVDTDGTYVLVNTVQTHQKVKNVARDPRVALTVSDPDEPSSYCEVRGRVVDLTTDGAVDHIEELAQRYTGEPYPWYGGRDQVRVIMKVEIQKLHAIGV